MTMTLQMFIRNKTTFGPITNLNDNFMEPAFVLNIFVFYSYPEYDGDNSGILIKNPESFLSRRINITNCYKSLPSRLGR